jgi:hypothetical protein
MPHDQICAACPCPYCTSMSMLHVHVHTACHVHVECLCQCCIPCQCCILCQCFMSMYIYVEMPECRTLRHPVSPVPDQKKLTMPKQVWYRTKKTQSGIFLVQYQDAGMPMPALVFSMQMPSYVTYACRRGLSM